MDSLTYNQVIEIYTYFESMFPEVYGYSSTSLGDSSDIVKYYIFRNRESSFDVKNALVVLQYKWEAI